MNIKTNLKSFIKGFKYAFEGVLYCIKSEKNMRFHLCAAFYVIIFMQFYDFSNSQKAIIFIVIGLVISLEMINTAIETVVDLCSPEYHKLAKKAKDVAAGAVLCSAIIAVIIGVELFWDIQTFKNIYDFFIRHILALTGLIISIVLWGLFIFVYRTTD